MAKRNGLGKGLDALFLDNNTENGSVTTLKISEIEPNKDQPRSVFAEEALGELADSIRSHGILQPLVVRPLEQGGYQIVAGERRWRAARRAGLSEVPAVIKDLTEEQTLEIAIIENLQREDLNVVELARGYQALMDQYGMTQEQVATRMGKSRSSIANTVRLLALPEPVLDEVAAGTVSTGHAKALMALESDKAMEEVATKVVRESLSVRELEKLIKQRKAEQAGEATSAGGKAASPGRGKTNAWGKNFYTELALAMEQEMGRYVRIQPEGRKTLTLEFYTEQDLLHLAALLTNETTAEALRLKAKLQDSQ